MVLYNQVKGNENKTIREGEQNNEKGIKKNKNSKDGYLQRM